jgi:hypothetical protein
MLFTPVSMLTFRCQFLINVSFNQLKLTFVEFFDQGKDGAKDILVSMRIHSQHGAMI